MNELSIYASYIFLITWLFQAIPLFKTLLMMLKSLIFRKIESQLCYIMCVIPSFLKLIRD